MSALTPIDQSVRGPDRGESGPGVQAPRHAAHRIELTAHGRVDRATAVQRHRAVGLRAEVGNCYLNKKSITNYIINISFKIY